MILRKKYRKQIIISILLIAFLGLILVVTTHETLGVDKIVYNTLIRLYSPNITKFFIGCTFLGSTYIIIAVTLLSTLLYYIKFNKKYYSLIPFFTPMIIYIINRVIKNIVQRPRPEILKLVDETDYSFPSGHTMESLAVYGLLIILISLTTKNKAIKYPLIALVSTIIVLIMISRIYLGVHYFSDIIGGILLSTSYLLFVSMYFEKN